VRLPIVCGVLAIPGPYLGIRALEGRQERAEIGARRDDGSVLRASAVEDLLVGRGVHPQFADVDGIVADAG
jgi:hypothetical protein